MELLIFLGAWALLVIGAVVGGADSRPGINESRDWGLHTWNRSD